MSAPVEPLILYVPGLLPKPPADLHRDALKRCLVSGVRIGDATVAAEIEASDHAFDLIAWTYDFYGEHRDYAIDATAVDDVVDTRRARPVDIAEATSWQRRATRWLYHLGDRLPFLIPHLANEKMVIHMNDLRRYNRDINGIAEHTREMLKLPLRAARAARRPVLLVAHSMGSVIAYEALWEMTHEHRDDFELDTLLTMGSPLGQAYVQRRLRGRDREGRDRYPHNVRRWLNVAAMGDLTAIDPTLANDYGEMLELGLVDTIDDRLVFNFFRLDGELNVHAEYGYFANEKTGELIAEWWRSVRS